MDREVKIVLLGQTSVGKSAICIQLICNHFIDEYDPTIEDSYRKQISVDSETYLIDILDTATSAELRLEGEFASTEYSEMREQYIRSTDSFVLVYAINSRRSFEVAQCWHEHILSRREYGTFALVLVGNKCDLDTGIPTGARGAREVPREEGQRLADSYACPFFETSCLTRLNVEECIYETVREVRLMRRGHAAPTTRRSGGLLGKLKRLAGVEGKESSHLTPPRMGPVPPHPLAGELQDTDFNDVMRQIYLDRARFADVHIVPGLAKSASQESDRFDDPLPCHRIILCSRSKALRNLILSLSESVLPSGEGMLELRCVSRTAEVLGSVTGGLETVIEYLYTGTVEGTCAEEFAAVALEFAEMYKLDGLSALLRGHTEGSSHPGAEEQAKAEAVRLQNDIRCSLSRGNRYARLVSDIRFLLPEITPLSHEGHHAPSMSVEVFAHRVLLYHAGEYFRAMFGSGMVESTGDCISMMECGLSVREFENALRYLATQGPCYITGDNASALLHFAHRHGLASLKYSSERYLVENMSPSNAVALYELSYACDALLLRRGCLHSLVVNFDSVFPDFPVFKEVHELLKADVKQDASLLRYLKGQQLYWNTHHGIYLPFMKSEWSMLLKRYNSSGNETALRCV